MRLSNCSLISLPSLKKIHGSLITLALLALSSTVAARAVESKSTARVEGRGIVFAADGQGGYTLLRPTAAEPIVHASAAVEVAGKTIRSADYPHHTATIEDYRDDLGAGQALIITNSGLANAPDLELKLIVHRDRDWGQIELTAVNRTEASLSIDALHSLHSEGADPIALGAPAANDRILSDSYSEDRPQLALYNLGGRDDGMYRGVGSQLIFNRKSGQSLFVGALTSEKLLTILHLKADATRLESWDVESTGTTEIMRGESLHDSPADEQVDLHLALAPGASLSGEQLMVAAGPDYHAALEEYGRVVRQLHHARVENPTPIGWWSWTAYYFNLNEPLAVANADWFAQNLKSLGYEYLQIDEGYQYARGEYLTPDVKLFPRGLDHTIGEIRSRGIRFGLWTAPFEVSERAWVFEHHKEWLLHNAQGKLIHIGNVVDGKDPLYALDTTNPEAQQYLRNTYKTLVGWGVRFFKFDFMDDSAVEGAYFRPQTTALEAERIGLKIIRDTVGNEVLIDKDGSPMLNPVGLVDCGRISQDTGHAFTDTKASASGIAARYYMNRNFFIADPDAFNTSAITVDGVPAQKPPLSLDEARASIALSAVSGGMFEIGDDLPALARDPERLALVKNRNLIEMARLGRASTPVDLMSYDDKDEQPSIFVLHESARQSVVTVFNWSDSARPRSISIESLGLKPAANYRLVELLGAADCCAVKDNAIQFNQSPHSARMFKLIDESVPAQAPEFHVDAMANASVGVSLEFKAASQSPLLACHWEFGDGATADECDAHHTYTLAGAYHVRATANGIDGPSTAHEADIVLSGTVSPVFLPQQKMRPE